MQAHRLPTPRTALLIALLWAIHPADGLAEATVRYAYDALGRPHDAEVAGGWVLSYRLDPAENRLRVESAGTFRADADGDGIVDAFDLCPQTADPRQLDYDADGAGNSCDGDDDDDGVGDDDDAFPRDANEQRDADADGIGDRADPDDDEDAVADWRDNCPLTPNPSQRDIDGDGIGSACEAGVEPRTLYLPAAGSWRAPSATTQPFFGPDRAALRARLDAYTQRLVAHLRSTHSASPVAAIIGGWQIRPTAHGPDNPLRARTHPHLLAPATAWPDAIPPTTKLSCGSSWPMASALTPLSPSSGRSPPIASPPAASPSPMTTAAKRPCA